MRVVGEGIEPGLYSIEQALRLAEEKEMDLVEVAPNVTPPVCRVIDYRKYLYEQKKKQKEMKAKTMRVVVKEIRFGPHTDEHDFNFKVKHAEKFLQDGSKVKAVVLFRGREIAFKEQGELLLLKMAQSLEEFGIVEQMPKMEGKRMNTLFTPKKRK